MRPGLFAAPLRLVHADGILELLETPSVAVRIHQDAVLAFPVEFGLRGGRLDALPLLGQGLAIGGDPKPQGRYGSQGNGPAILLDHRRTSEGKEKIRFFPRGW